MDYNTIIAQLDKLPVKTLLAVMRALNGSRTLGYDYMKKSKQELQSHAYQLARDYVSSGHSHSWQSVHDFIESTLKDGRVEGEATGGTTAGTHRNAGNDDLLGSDKSTGEGTDYGASGDVSETHGGRQGGKNTKSGKTGEDKTEGGDDQDGGGTHEGEGSEGSKAKDGEGESWKGRGKKEKAPRKAPTTAEEMLAEAVRSIMEQRESEKEAEGEGEGKFDPKELERLIQKEMEKRANVYRVVVKKEDPFAADVKLEERPRHLVFKEVLEAVGRGLHVLLVGPAGCGKTWMAEEIAMALGLKFRFTGAVASEYKLLGFITANGVPVRTEYREAYEHGGLFLWDELDASAAQAMLSFNAGLANGHQDFPDAIVKRHTDFRAIASANTYGHGADRVYVGRNQLDAASLDRFYIVAMDYDEDLEKHLYGDGEWVRYVHRTRKAVQRLSLRHVVSMRAIDMGLRMLKSSVPRGDIERAVLWKQLSREDVGKIKSHM